MWCTCGLVCFGALVLTGLDWLGGGQSGPRARGGKRAETGSRLGIRPGCTWGAPGLGARFGAMVGGRWLAAAIRAAVAPSLVSALQGYGCYCITVWEVASL